MPSPGADADASIRVHSRGWHRNVPNRPTCVLETTCKECSSRRDACLYHSMDFKRSSTVQRFVIALLVSGLGLAAAPSLAHAQSSGIGSILLPGGVYYPSSGKATKAKKDH